MLQNAFEPHGDRVVFANTQSDAKSSVRSSPAGVYSSEGSTEMASKNRAILANDAETTDNLRVMIGGMPNVGKSSLLNALRRVGMHKGCSRNGFAYAANLRIQRRRLLRAQTQASPARSAL
jgi:ribosome biogenesis GTPase A